MCEKYDSKRIAIVTIGETKLENLMQNIQKMAENAENIAQVTLEKQC